MANTEQVIVKRIQLRRDTYTNWLAADPVLADGEIAYVKDLNFFRIGDGIKKFSELQNLTVEDSPQVLSHINNLENPHEVTKEQVGLGNVDDTSDVDKPISTLTQEALNTKVDKITGKGLSEADFTNAEKTKLGGIATNANNYVHPNHSGDVTSTGDGATTISNNAVGNSKLDDVPNNTFKGRVSSGTGDPEDLTVAQVKTALSINNVDNTSDINKPISNATQDALDNKVDKVTGKQLSTEDYTSAEKTKLSGIETGAQVNTVTSVAGRTGAVTLTKSDVGLNNVDNVKQAPLTHVGATGDAHGNATPSVAGFMSSSDKTKLDGIETGAEVNTVNSVAGKTGNVTLNRSDVGLDSAITNETDIFTPDKVEHIVTLTQAEYDAITPADDTIYIITDAPAIPEPTQAALDELDLRKADVSLLSSNITLFPTNVASDVSGYFKMVTNLNDPDYNTTAINIPTGVITSNAQLLASLASSANLFVGNPGYINITTIGNIRKTSGNANQFAEFYFQVFQRAANGTETLLSTSDTTGAVNPASNNYLEFSATALLNNGEFLSTDRIVIKYYANLVGNSGATYDFQFGGTNPVRTLLPVPVSVLVSNEAEAVVYDNTASQRNVFNVQDAIDKTFDEIDSHVNNTTNPHSVTKTQVGLGNVDNTSDLNKPISTATQTALNGKENAFTKNTAFNKNFGTTAGTVLEGNHHGSNGNVHAVATTSVNGFMSAADKTKLNGIETGAQVNTVTSVAGKTGAVTLTKNDVGLNNVTNDAQVKKASSSTIGNVPIWSSTTGDSLDNGYGIETTLVGDSLKLATAAAIKAYVDLNIAGTDSMVFKGTLGTGGTYTSLPNTYAIGWTLKVIEAGTYAGKVAEIGDMYIALQTREGTGNLDSDWSVIQTNIDGAVTGPSSSVNNHVALFDGTSGKTIKSSGVTLNNATLTLGTSGIATGSQTWTANQGTNATFTVNVPGTNIAQGTRTTTTVPITSSTGTGATLSAATTSLAGVMSSADKTKLDGIATGATANVGTVTSVATGTGLSGGTIVTTGTISLTGQALALHNLATNGLIARTGTEAVASRTLTASTGISITNGDGVSGNPTITNTAPDQVVTLTGSGATSVTGTYPNFTISSTDTNTTYSLITEAEITTGTGTTGRIISAQRLKYAFDNVKAATAGNADTVTNGVYTTGSYSNPAWITTLAWDKLTGVPTYDNYSSWLLAANGTAGTQAIGSGGTATFSGGTSISVTRSGGTVTITNTAPHVATNLSYTASTRVLASSTGTNVTLPQVTTSLDGLMIAADKSKLDGIAAGAQVNVGTDLGTSVVSTNSRAITSSTGANVTIPVATTVVAGFMSHTDKSKLDGIAVGAQTNQNAFSNIAISGQTTVAADTATDTLTLVNGTGISMTTNATTDTITVTNTAPHVATNLGYTTAATTGTVTSSTGANATIPAATTSLAGLMTNADKTKLDGIATGANNYVLPAATSTVLGGIELFSDTVQSVAANAVTATASRTYGIQVNSAGQCVVNVPWVDTNTTYSAGSGIGLSGTQFSVAGGTGLTQDTSGLSLTAITAGNATVGALRYNSTTRVAGQMYGGTTAPASTTRVNYDGDFYAYRHYAINDIVAYASDKRLKTNVKPIVSAIDKVKSLSGFTFDWNTKGQEILNDPTRQLGVFAQDVQVVLPEAVTIAPFDRNENGESISGENYLTVKYEKLIPLLIEAIKEQQKQIEHLISKIS